MLHFNAVLEDDGHKNFVRCLMWENKNDGATSFRHSERI